MAYTLQVPLLVVERKLLFLRSQPVLVLSAVGSGGILPPNELYRKLRDVNLVKFAICVGIAPFKPEDAVGFPKQKRNERGSVKKAKLLPCFITYLERGFPNWSFVQTMLELWRTKDFDPQ